MTVGVRMFLWTRPEHTGGGDDLVEELFMDHGPVICELVWAVS